MTADPKCVPLPGSSYLYRSSGESLRFSNLRGVRWRIDLGVLPSSSSASIDDMRRIAADARRSYATLRRRLLIDPHVSKDGNRSDLSMDNPLSQNPESIWGRFFRNAELEKAVDQDLSRLYPEDDHYIQTHACQAMLKRILLVWCLRHPECGYRQGMHELLAPLVYVLHVDLDYLSEVRGLYEEYFKDEFDGADCEVVSNCTLKKIKSWDVGADADHFKHSYKSKITSSNELGPDNRDVLLLSDSYGAEGELGIVLSEKFMEHDAYCMFDCLMNGAHGVVAMKQFYCTCASMASSTGAPPIIEASSAIYHLLSIVDSSLHSHLVELGVEPQYFALRWLRVLFGREFSLADLLVIWDEIFSSLNDSCIANDECKFKIMCSPQGAFISAIAVSMLLHVRSMLLATENATSCLKRLLNFPNNISVERLLEKARSCQVLSLETNMLVSSVAGLTKNGSSAVSRTGSQSPNSPIRIMPDSYWEEKWRVLHKEKVLHGDSSNGRHIKGPLETLGSLSTESYPSPLKNANRKKEEHSFEKHSLFDAMSLNVESGGDVDGRISSARELSPVDEVVRNCFPEEQGYESSRRASEFMGEECLSTENFSVISMNTGPNSEAFDPEIESENSSLTSNSFIRENDVENDHVDEENNNAYNPEPKKPETYDNDAKSGPILNVEVKGEIRVRKPASGKFHWLWRIGKGNSHEWNMGKGAIAEALRFSNSVHENAGQGKFGRSPSDCSTHGDSARIEVLDKKMTDTLKNLGQSILENVLVIESALQHEQGQAGDAPGSNGQAAAMKALKDLRKISIILSEM